ncbi:retrotransposon protein, putative, ty1-copia subclass [Tanacetum coccineum]
MFKIVFMKVSSKKKSIWIIMRFLLITNHPSKVYKLQRSIYRLKQASRSWNKRFDEEIKKFAFHQNLDEPCVYQKASRSNVIFLILYGDGIILMGNHITKSSRSLRTLLSKQSNTAQHSTEAEYIAASEAAKEAVWIRKFIDELGIVPLNDYPIKMNCENSAAIIIAKESGIQKGAGHFQRKYQYRSLSAFKTAKLIC